MILHYTFLDLIALGLAAVHFSIPLAYYLYAKARWLPRPWNLKTDPNYRPKVSVIIPTYNEAELIEKKLDNIYMQDYPRDKLEVIVVDSASTDGTVGKVEEWSKRHSSLNLKLIQEPVRLGKAHAVRNIIREVAYSVDVIIITDVDAFFPPETLRQIVEFFGDETVGAVTASIKYIKNNKEENSVEDVYRNFYNQVRVAESKKLSTPVHNGPLQAFRADILKKIGLPDFPGVDDSAFASYIAFAGYRAIQLDNVWVYEPHRGSVIKRKIRRAQHLIINFLCTKRYAKKLGIYKKTKFDTIWKIEAYLHLINPSFLIAAIIFLLLGLVWNSVIAATLLILGIVSLLYKPFRVWVINQLYLIIASVRNLWTKEIIWSR